MAEQHARRRLLKQRTSSWTFIRYAFGGIIATVLLLCSDEAFRCKAVVRAFVGRPMAVRLLYYCSTWFPAMKVLPYWQYRQRQSRGGE